MNNHLSRERTRGPIAGFFYYLGLAFSWLRAIIVNGLLIVLLIFIISSLDFGLKPLPDKAPLRLRISGYLVDQKSAVDPVAQALAQVQGGNAETVVRDIVRTINAAATDDRISKLIMELDLLAGGGISKLEEIGQALNRFKTSGKEIIAISDSYSQQQYYLASYADQIVMHPMGSVMLTGFGAYQNYFKDALDKLEVNMHVFRVGDYKDAVEPFTRNDMSPESREHNSQWINQLWSVYTSRVESMRQLPTGAIDDYINNMSNQLQTADGDSAQYALNNRLVDQLSTRNEWRRKLIQEFGEDNNDYKAIDYQNYLAHLRAKTLPNDNNIGLIVASGTIYDGRQPAGNIGGDSLAQLIRQARDVNKVKALVLRVDSGGGSAFASELIRNELIATQNAGIPVVVSMGSVAASGGYWIAANADEIWATPTTITGSIGVFSILPTLENSLAKIGINTDGIGTTELADALRIDRPLSPSAAAMLQQQVDNIYRKFIGLVSEGRELHPDFIHPIAQGRVWSGTSAQEFQLVDKLGYLEEAIASAAKLVNVSDYHVELIEAQPTFFELFMQSFAVKVAAIGYSLNSDSNWLQDANIASHVGIVDNLQNILQLINLSRPSHSTFAFCMSCSVVD